MRRKWHVLASLCARDTVQLLQQETPDFISPDLCPPNSPVDTEIQSTTKFSDWSRNVYTLYKTRVRPRHQPLWLATWSSAFWHMGKRIKKRHQQSSWSMEKAVTCKHEGKRTSLWTSAKLKPALFRANTIHNLLFSEPPTVYRGKRVVSRHFRRSYLKANKVSKSERIRKFENAYHF